MGALKQTNNKLLWNTIKNQKKTAKAYSSRH